jgi:hypothetical protein
MATDPKKTTIGRSKRPERTYNSLVGEAGRLRDASTMKLLGDRTRALIVETSKTRRGHQPKAPCPNAEIELRHNPDGTTSGIIFERGSDGTTKAKLCGNTMGQVQVSYRQYIPDFQKVRTRIFDCVENGEEITAEQLDEEFRGTHLGNDADRNDYAQMIRKLSEPTEDRRKNPLSPAKLSRWFIHRKTGLRDSALRSYISRQEKLLGGGKH